METKCKLKESVDKEWSRILHQQWVDWYRRNTKVYISGPMSGIPRDEYLKRFRECEKLLRANGYQNIVNPINVWACRWPWLYRLLGYRLVLWYDIQLLKRCDAICLMEGWSGSYGCLHELCDAWDRNMTIINERDFVRK